MPGEDTSNTGADAPVADPSNEGDPESGGVTADDIASALGPQYKTVAPVVEEEPEEEPEAPEEPEEEPEDELEEEPEAPKPTPAKTPEVPTDDVSDKFSITVKDDDGITFKINAGDDLDEVLAEANISKVSKIMSIMRQLDKVERDKEQYEADEATTAAENDRNERITSIQQGWDSEVKELQAQKRIPTTAKGADNERVAEVYKFMGEENDKRIASNKPAIMSFEDALDKLENKEAREAKTKAETDAKDTARKNGGLIGGNGSGNTSGAAPVYRAGSARNSTQALKALNLL